MPGRMIRTPKRYVPPSVRRAELEREAAEHADYNDKLGAYCGLTDEQEREIDEAIKRPSVFAAQLEKTLAEISSRTHTGQRNRKARNRARKGKW